MKEMLISLYTFNLALIGGARMQGFDITSRSDFMTSRMTSVLDIFVNRELHYFFRSRTNKGEGYLLHLYFGCSYIEKRWWCCFDPTVVIKFRNGKNLMGRVFPISLSRFMQIQWANYARRLRERLGTRQKLRYYTKGQLFKANKRPQQVVYSQIWSYSTHDAHDIPISLSKN